MSGVRGGRDDVQRLTVPRGNEGGAVAGVLAWLRRRLHGFYAVAGVLLTGGLAAALLALWALSGLTVGVVQGRTRRFDEGVLLWMSRRANPALDVAAMEVTALGSGLVVSTVALVAGTLLWQMGRRACTALLAAGVGGAWVIYPVLKHVFDRPRPQIVEWRAHHATSWSYPSGHATMAMVLLVLLAYIVHRLSRRRWTGVAAMLLAGIAVVLVGLSRLYLGVHYPSDVIAGFGVGFAWAVFCAVAVEALRHPREAHADAADASP